MGKTERLFCVKPFRQLRKRGPLEHVKISMVVQHNNYREMPEFVHLGNRHSFDVVYFSKLMNRGTFSRAEYCDRAIHLADHPCNADFIDMLGNDIFRDPIVHLGNLTGFAARYAFKEERTFAI